MTGLKFNGKAPYIHLPEIQTNLYATPANLVQKYMLIPSQVRDAYLCHLFTTTLPPSSTSSAIVFVNKCSTAERLRLMLIEMGVKCTGLHAKMDQKERIGSLAKFRSMIVHVLITTDVGSRYIHCNRLLIKQEVLIFLQYVLLLITTFQTMQLISYSKYNVLYLQFQSSRANGTCWTRWNEFVICLRERCCSN